MNWAGNTMADLCEADVHRTDRLAEYRVGDQIIQRDSNIRVIYILKDHLGSCGHKVLENNGLWRYEETTPFGQTVMSGYRLNTQQKKFVGKEQDESRLPSGLSVSRLAVEHPHGQGRVGEVDEQRRDVKGSSLGVTVA